MAISDNDRSLLERHVPELRYHPREAYRADSAATFTEAFCPGRHSNELRVGKTGRLIAQVRPTAGVARLSLATLAPNGKRYFPGGDKAAKGDYLLGHPRTLRDDWQVARKLPGLADRVYCRIAHGTEGRRWLQYWLFFYDNPFKRFGFGRHQGDWEWIQIGVVDGKPLCASYSQHGESESRDDWRKVPTVGKKGVVPIVYVAKDSHALYYEADKHVRIFGVANDHTADGGVALRPEPYILDEDGEDDWIHWPGTWGPEGSPAGPPSKDAWEKPEEFHANRVKGGLFAGLEAPSTPSEPDLLITLDQDTVLVSYALAPRRPGRSDPARLELALYGSGPRPIPSVTVADITEARGEVRLPLPFDDGPYTLHPAVYDSDDQESLLAPREVAVPRGAGLEARPRVLRPAPAARAPIALSQVGLTVIAPSADATDRVALEQAAGRLEVLGPRVVVEHLFRGDDPGLRRHFVVRGLPTEAPRTDAAATAFEAARSLQSTLPEGWEVYADPPGAAGNPAGEAESAALGDGSKPDNWAIEELCCPEAWKLPPNGGAAQGAGIVIAQPDTGFTDHPELELGALDRLRDHDVLTGRDDAHAVLRGFPPLAFPSHGTGTASVAVSREDGEITGAAPKATIVPIRAAESVIHVRNAELALAVEYAVELGADVITISMGGVLYPRSLQAIIERAVADGRIVMAAAGQFIGLVVWPARFPECLAVGGSARDYEPWRWSSVGPEVDISAPAKDVWVAATRNRGAKPFRSAPHDGTSFAVALTAGVAALWLAHHGGRAKVAEAVGGKQHVQAAFRALVRRECTTPDGWDTERRGAGLVNARKLLAARLESWRGAEDEPSTPRTDAEGRVLEAAAVMAPEEVEEGQPEKRLLALFDGDRAKLARFGDEVVYRMAEDEELRTAVLSSPGAGLEAAGPALLRAVASPSLREALA
jgi:hypothetical protein